MKMTINALISWAEATNNLTLKAMNSEGELAEVAVKTHLPHYHFYYTNDGGKAVFKHVLNTETGERDHNELLSTEVFKWVSAHVEDSKIDFTKLSSPALMRELKRRGYAIDEGAFYCDNDVDSQLELYDEDFDIESVSIEDKTEIVIRALQSDLVCSAVNTMIQEILEKEYL